MLDAGDCRCGGDICVPVAGEFVTADAGYCSEDGPCCIWSGLALLGAVAHGVIATVGECFMLPSLFADPFFGAIAAVTMGLRLCMKVSFRSSCEPRAVCLSLCRAHRSCRTKDR
jgi:hypothetical protein